MDMHPPEGIDRSDIPPINKISVPRVYDVPLRACISWKVPNLMFAGRNVSASHVAFSSMRVMATCAAMGQGVGTAAAQAVQEGLQPGDLAADASQVQRLQQQLLRDDMYLLGVRNEDSADLARQATVRAASARPGGDPDHVLSGQTRSLHAERGNPERSPAGTHRWMSDPDAGLPAWIELSWDQPIRPREVQLVFDTGLHRVLTLSHSEALVQHMEYGRPQSETVRDYRIEGLTDGRWQDLAEVTGNYQRRRRHAVDPAGPVEAVRVHVSATNGLDHARIAEIRVYE
jgi:hypothetical protein